MTSSCSRTLVGQSNDEPNLSPKNLRSFGTIMIMAEAQDSDSTVYDLSQNTGESCAQTEENKIGQQPTLQDLTELCNV